MLLVSCIQESMGEGKMNVQSQRVIRQAVGSGRWFPGNRETLQHSIEDYINQARLKDIQGRIVGVMAPHAGYPYCGKVAGYVYSAIRDQAQAGDVPDTVVILGISHRGGFPGVVLMDGDAIATPLGEAQIDKEATSVLAGKSDLIRMDYTPHNGEWSAENQVPFVQTVLPGTPLVIAIIGDHDMRTTEALVAALDELARKKKILVIASTDMLHNADYDLVTRTDKDSLKLVSAMKIDNILKDWSYRHQTFCGVMALVVTMRFAEHQGCHAGMVLYYRNSGDDFPDSRGQWVVGYGAAVFTVFPEKK